MRKIIECVPNFSEGRRRDVVDALADALTAVPGVALLDTEMDAAHNRCVITVAGDPEAIAQGAIEAVGKAVELIDLRKHRGEHPRMGAADVIPFIPISNASIQDCIDVSVKVARAIADRYSIPVYLYEQSARIPERQDLAHVRKGQFEGIQEEIASNPQRKPDFGPSHLGPAGATVIGARHPLIAYNVYLNTADLSVAKTIAKGLRQSSGGYRYVKALGMLVEGMAQVSMNLTNFRQTPVFRVVETVRREAARYGVIIHHSELVGLIPQAALVDAAVWYTQLDGFGPDQILETRLYQSLAAESSPALANSFIEDVAAATAAPGGGSVAAHAAALGAALAEMVAGLTIGKGKYKGVEGEMQGIMLEDEGVFGTVHIGIGTNITLGGRIKAAIHYDLILWHPTVELDGRVVLEYPDGQHDEIAEVHRIHAYQFVAVGPVHLGGDAFGEAGRLEILRRH